MTASMFPQASRRSLTFVTLLLVLALALPWLALSAQPAQAVGSIIYVEPGATGNGTSWGDATTLSDALSQASSSDQIWVAAGTHKPTGSGRDSTFLIPSGVSVYGGFAGNEGALADRDMLANETILSGDIGTDASGNAYSVVQFPASASSSTVLDGFTITGGNANALQTNEASRLGGAVYVTSSANPTLNNLIIQNNSALAGGGVAVSSNSSPTLNNIVFIGNDAQSNADFSDAGTGGGLYINSSAPLINNATFYNNTAGNTGGAFYTGFVSTPTFNNSIVWGNTSAQVAGTAGTSTTINTSIIEGDCPDSLFSCSGIITSDPLFVDTASDDLRLQISPLSPGVDAGDDAAVSTDVDVQGKTRQFDFATASAGTTVDIGAYEFVNDAPEALTLNNQQSVSENNTSTVVVGDFSTDDPNNDVGDDHTYTLDVVDTYFEIVGDNLQTTSTALNYEDLPASPGLQSPRQYTVTVVTEDLHGDTFTEDIVINIDDVNETPTEIFLSGSDNSAAFDIDEEQAAGTVVGPLTTDDPDQTGDEKNGDGDSHTYSLAAGVLDNDQFQISGSDLQTAEVFSYEDPDNTDQQYEVQVTSTDEADNSIDRIFTIDINDVNETPSDISLRSPDATIPATPGTVDENITAVTDVAHFDAVDVDLDNGGNGDSHTYSLPAATLNNDLFTIGSDDGLLKTANGVTFDFEDQSEYPIQVRTEDSGSLATTKTFTITVNDVNEQPTALTFSDDTTEAQVAENQPAGTAVGTLKTEDDDLNGAGDTHTYSFAVGAGSSGNNLFQIVGDELQTRLMLNYEKAGDLGGGKFGYTVRIRTTDEEGLFFEQVFTIEVTDEDDVPTAITLSPDSIAENSATNTVIGFLETDDQDPGGTYTYTLGIEPNDNFQISGDQLIAKTSFNYEEVQGYTLTVTSTNTKQGQDPVVFADDVTVNIINVNEDPEDVNFANGSKEQTILDSLVTGDPVSKLVAVDPDAAVPGNDTFTYALLDDAGGTFVIGGEDGDMLLVNTDNLDVNTQDTYTVTVQVTDSGGKSASSQLTINLVEEFEKLYMPLIVR